MTGGPPAFAWHKICSRRGVKILERLVDLDIRLTSPAGLVIIGAAFVTGYVIRAVISYRRRKAARRAARRYWDRFGHPPLA